MKYAKNDEGECLREEVGFSAPLFRGLFCFFLLLPFSVAQSAEIKTNGVHMADAPKWLTANRVDRVVNRIQSLMEWSIRRIEVSWYPTEEAFAKANHLGPMAIAFALRSDDTVHLGPRVTDANFDQVFGHELVHVISHQKYKEAIPKWLEEGLANHLTKNGKVDYKWLASQPFPQDLHELVHPYNGSTDHIRYHYVASQALAEMIASKCNITDLLRLSVGRKLENYLANICEIHDLNADFKKWVDKHKTLGDSGCQTPAQCVHMVGYENGDENRERSSRQL